MAKFQGFADVSMDDRGRIAIPAKFVKTIRSIDASYGRESKDDENLDVVIGMTMGEHLGIFPKTVHDNLCEVLENGPSGDQDWEDMTAWVTGQCETVPLDKQNRVKIPSLLAKKLHLSGQVFIRAAGEHLEVIDMNEWESQFDSQRGKIKGTRASVKDRFQELEAEMKARRQ
ncbi:hypothetical protein KQI84_05830 [bacterium]|nr:hypothetical protein [bacterium]